MTADDRDKERWVHTPPREPATFDRATTAEIHRAAPPASTTSAASAPSGACRISTTSSSSTP
jgi:hypothetical protein